MERLLNFLKQNRHFIMLAMIAVCIVTAITTYEMTYVDDSPADVPQMILNSAELYDDSLKSFGECTDCDLTIRHKKDIYSDTTLSETSETSISYRHQGDTFQSTLKQNIKISSHSVDVTGVYDKGIGYFTVGNGKFCSSMTPASYAGSIISIGYLDQTLYGRITAVKNNKSTRFLLSDSKRAETWSIPDGADFLQSSAVAEFSADGMCVNICYVVIYRYNSIVFSEKFEIQIVKTTASLSLPELSGYTSVNDPTLPIVLERSCGYLLAAQNLSSVTKETILCQTFGDERTSTFYVSMTDGKDFTASMQTDIEQISTSRGGEKTQLNQSVKYENGVYSLSLNGAEPTEITDIEPEQVRTHCRDFFVGTILLPEDISDFTVEESETTLKYSFTANSAELINRLRQKASEDLYANKLQLDNLYQNEQVTAYLTVDRYAGFPTGAGIHYEGSHTINDIVYKLVYESVQTFQAENNAVNNP